MSAAADNKKRGGETESLSSTLKLHQRWLRAEKTLLRHDHLFRAREFSGIQPKDVYPARKSARVPYGVVQACSLTTGRQGGDAPSRNGIHGKRHFAGFGKRVADLRGRVERIRIVLKKGARGRKGGFVVRTAHIDANFLAEARCPIEVYLFQPVIPRSGACRGIEK